MDLRMGLLCLLGRPNPFPIKEEPMKGQHWITIGSLALTLVAYNCPPLRRTTM